MKCWVRASTLVRSKWWLERMRRGGPVLVPSPDREIQPIDVRDVANFLVNQIERRAHGVFNVAATNDGRTFGGMVKLCGELVAAGRMAVPELVWADEDWLVEHGVRQWTELPLWRNAAALWSVSVRRAVGAGLQCRRLAESVSEAWRWLQVPGMTDELPLSAEYGINPAREAEIIARWREAANCRSKA